MFGSADCVVQIAATAAIQTGSVLKVIELHPKRRVIGGAHPCGFEQSNIIFAEPRERNASRSTL
jgi:hypothetical protein